MSGHGPQAAYKSQQNPTAGATVTLGKKAAKSAHDAPESTKQLHVWQAEQGSRPPQPPSEVQQRKDRLKDWGQYNGLNIITNQEVDNRSNAVHSATIKPAHAPPTRGKVAQSTPDPYSHKSVHVGDLMKTTSGSKEFLQALQDHTKR